MRLGPGWWGCAVLLAVASACAGTGGKDGASASVTVADEPAGPSCASGGKRITVQSGPSDPVVTYVCNGTNGADGAAATVTVTDEPAGANCASGGKKVVTQVSGQAPVT